jgi:hypothetical protein
MHDPLRHLLQQADATLSEPPRAISAETLLAASRRQCAQTKRRRIATVGVTAALASVAIAFVAASSSFTKPREMRVVLESGAPTHINIPAPRTPDELRQEIVALEREAAWRTKMTKGLIANNMSPLGLLSPFGETQDTETANSHTLADLADSRNLGEFGVHLADSQNPEEFAPPSAPLLNVPSLNNAEWLRVEIARSAALSWQYANMAEYEFRDLAAARREYERLIERFPGTTWAQRSQVSLDRILTSENTPL